MARKGKQSILFENPPYILGYASVAGKEEKEEFDSIASLSTLTNTEAPTPLATLKDKKVRFTESCDKEDMPSKVLSF